MPGGNATLQVMRTRVWRDMLLGGFEPGRNSLLRSGGRRVR